MKKIILASQSKQRQNLFKLLEIPFVVKSSSVQEWTEIKSNCAHFVKSNALLKARDIASREKNAIVIGADTVGYLGGKRLILKPKSLKEARDNLKDLMSSPQWIYTGLAIIDTQAGREVVGFEKTKVFMTMMSDQEITKYHKKVPPFDKAGGFDIEGLGSVFIHRIEGCYTNVIGLPMAKLRLMLKEVDVHVL